MYCNKNNQQIPLISKLSKQNLPDSLMVQLRLVDSVYPRFLGVVDLLGKKSSNAVKQRASARNQYNQRKNQPSPI